MEELGFLEYSETYGIPLIKPELLRHIQKCLKEERHVEIYDLCEEVIKQYQGRIDWLYEEAQKEKMQNVYSDLENSNLTEEDIDN